MILLKKLVKSIFVFIMIVGLVGCGKTQGRCSKKIVLSLDWWANPNHVPIYVGVEKKIFKKYGIDLQILNLQEPPDSLVYLLSNQVDVSLYYLPHCLKGYARSPTFKVIGKLTDEALFSFIYRKDSSIKTIEDFNGKTLGVFSDCMSRAVIDSLAKDKKEIRFGMLKTLQFDLATVLYTKALDVVSGAYWNIEPFQLKSQGIEVGSCKWSDLGLPQYPELVFICSQAFLDKDPTFAKHFKAALHESISFCLKEPEKAFELYLKQHPEKKSASWEREAWSATYSALAKSQEFDLVALKQFYKWMVDCKILPGEFKAEEILESN